jgi:Ala-tRNA(Pro) deacylase
MVKADGRLMMTVLPADHVIDMKTLKARIGCDKLTLASERDFRERFVPCLTGAMPPFGRLFGFTVLCDRTLAEKPEIEFNAGTHIDTIRMSFWKFVQMETPVMTDFSEKATGKWRARAA